jgi:hypothetical protein
MLNSGLQKGQRMEMKANISKDYKAEEEILTIRSRFNHYMFRSLSTLVVVRSLTIQDKIHHLN